MKYIYSTNSIIIRKSYGDFHLTIGTEIPERYNGQDIRYMIMQMLSDIACDLTNDYLNLHFQKKYGETYSLELNVSKELYQLIFADSLQDNIPLNEYVGDCLTLGYKQKLLDKLNSEDDYKTINS